MRLQFKRSYDSRINVDGIEGSNEILLFFKLRHVSFSILGEAAITKKTNTTLKPIRLQFKTQCIKRILDKITKARNETFAG